MKCSLSINSVLIHKLATQRCRVDKALHAASTHHLLTVDALRLYTLPGWVKSLSEITLNKEIIQGLNETIDIEGIADKSKFVMRLSAVSMV